MSGSLVVELATLLLVGAGMVLLVLSAERAGAIVQIGRQIPFTRTWRVLRALMFGFAASYAVFIGLVLVGASAVMAAMSGVVLGGGGLFVFLVTRNSHETLAALVGQTLARRHVADVVNALADGVLVIDPKGKILSANRRMGELVGVGPVALRGTSAAALLVPPEVIGDGAGRLREATLRRQGGGSIPVEVQYVEVEGEDGASRTGLLVVRDRREILRRELQVESAVKASEAALRARLELGAVLNAEVRPRLEAVSGALDVVPSEGAEGALARAQESLSGALTALAGVLDAEGARGVVARIIELEEFLEGVREAVERSAPGVRVETRLGADVPRRCRGRETTLREVLTSIAAYIVGVADPEGILFSIERTPGDEQRLLFRVTCVCDASHVTAAPIAGQGLGLAAARLLVQTLGGTLRQIGDRESRGEFTFTALLPPADADEAASPTPGETSPLMLVAAMAAHSSGSMSARLDVRGSVLVVDDAPIAREALTRLVRDLGYEVESVGTGNACVERAAEKAFDVILLDLVLPDISGLDVIAAVRARESSARASIVMVSAVEETRSIAACLERGADDYLTKPVNPIVLKARLHGILENRALSRQATRQVARLEEEIRRADSLLRAILPRPIADELQTTGSVAPRRHADVVVLFADIVGFTAYCDGRAPEDVLVPLQALVREFEVLCRRHGVLKIKTVGDALIACGGLLDRNDDAAERCVALGFALLDASARLPEGWRLRVGIHRGPVVAGVVGSHQFSYDIWGDTVNTAQRIEAHGQVGEVCVSAAVRAALPSRYAAESAGVVEMKGKGQVELFVIRRALALAAGAA